MKRRLQLIAIGTGIAATMATADETLPTVTIDHDPKTMAEFKHLARDAVAKGAFRVRFPSGECTVHRLGLLDLPTKEKFSEWSSSDRVISRKALEVWLTENMVSAVGILMTGDLDPSIFFDVERILRSRKIPYFVSTSEPLKNKKKQIRLVETDGRAKVASEPESEADKGAEQGVEPDA